MAYHIIKPSIIQILLKTFLWSNIALAAVTIITRLQMVHKTTSHPRWKDYFSIKRKENRFAQIALVASVMVTICVLLVIPDTHAERIRKLAEKGNAEAMIELGDYYMQYDKDVEKAIEWYKKAQKQGADVSDCISNATKRNNTQLTDSMKVEAYIALLSNYQLRGLDAVRKMENGFFNSGDVNTIMNYYDNNGEAYIRWLSFSAPLFSPKTEVYYANLGYEFWRGEYVEQDLVRAFELYLKGKSHQNVIKCYLNGWGVEKSLKSAIEYVEVEGCYDEAIAAFSPIKLFQR